MGEVRGVSPKCIKTWDTEQLLDRQLGDGGLRWEVTFIADFQLLEWSRDSKRAIAHPLPSEIYPHPSQFHP